MFRAREEELTLEALARADAPVVALGGGATGSTRVREALAESDRRVVWMDVAPDVAWERAHDAGRPLARDRESFKRLHAEREPVYAALADATVPAERGTEMGAVLAALKGLPKREKLLWAASASGDYPVYVGSGLVTGSGFWPSTVRGRRYLITDDQVAPRRYGTRRPALARGRPPARARRRSRKRRPCGGLWRERA